MSKHRTAEESSTVRHNNSKSPELKINDNRIFLAGAAVALIAILPFNQGFYVFVRITVTLCAFYGVYVLFAKRESLWLVFGCIAIFYNPIMPVYLGDKSQWLFFNFLTAFLFLWLYIRSEGLAEVRRKIRSSSGERILFYSSKLVILGSLAFWGWIVFDIVTRPSIHPINWVNVVLVFCLSWLGAVAISYLINKILLDRKTIWIKQSFSTYKSQEDLGYLNDKEAHL